MPNFALLLATILSLVYAQLRSQQAYAPIDDRSNISFTIRNFGISIEGTFSGLRGTIEFEPHAPSKANKIALSVDASTIETGITLRNNHLKKEDFFHVERYPNLAFTSNDITKQGDKWIATGRLSIKGKTREVNIPFDAIVSGNELRLSGEFKVNRKDFGVGGSPIGMSDEVTVTFYLVGIKVVSN